MNKTPCPSVASVIDNKGATSRWKPYPNYKDSGIEWLGEVPEHWRIKPIKRFVGYNNEALSETTDPDYEIEYLDISSVDEVAGVTMTEVFRFEDAPSRARRRVREGDVIVSTVRTYLKAIASIHSPPSNLVVSTGFCVIRPHNELNTGFAAYLFKASYLIDEIVARSFGVSYPSINASELVVIKVALPPLPEQRAIAAFLDRETGRIDTLIAKKERLIDLLQEKRAALISHAVTKGINPNAKMKDFGIEWLGEMPEHWEVRRVKYIARIKYGLGEPPERLEDGLPFIRATDIHRGKINSEAIQRVDPQDIPWSRDPELRANDILVVRSGAYTGDSAIVPEEWAGAIAGYDMVLRVTGPVPRFVAYVLLGKYLLDGQIYLERKRAAQPHLNAEELGAFLILLPPCIEQEEIVSYLDREIGRIDALIDKVKKSIDLLGEYRTALISAAVTGKIDVRQEVV